MNNIISENEFVLIRDAYFRLVEGKSFNTFEDEKLIAKDCIYSFSYAHRILKKRFLIAEENILSDPAYKKLYIIKVILRTNINILYI